MIWLGIPREDIVLGGVFSKLKQAVVKAEVAHVAVREAEAMLAKMMEVMDRVEKLLEFRETAMKLGHGDLATWAELLKAAAARPGVDPDAARVLAVVGALLSAGGDWKWRPGHDTPPALRLAASHGQRCIMLAQNPAISAIMEQISTALRELMKARKEADEAYQKELKESRDPVKKISPIMVKTVERIAVRGSRSMVAHRVLAGGDHAVALQDMGNNPREVEATGLLVADRSKGGKGPSVDQQVALLQDALRAGTPLIFATDTPGLQGFGPTVVISAFEVLASESLLGAVRFRYRLVEAPPSPPKRKPRPKKEDAAKDWVRLQAVRRSTAYADRFLNPATGRLHSNLAEVVRDRMLKLGTVTGLL